MRRRNRISIIIPAYNEIRTISSIVEIVRNWGKAEEIIIVDDGSSDHTSDAVKRFQAWVKLVSLPDNRGKGYAVATGIAQCHGEVIFLLDADIVGLTQFDLDELVEPIMERKADMVIGIHNFWKIGNFTPYDHVSGHRIFFKENVLHALHEMKQAKGGVEILINALHSEKRVVSVVQPYVFTLKKVHKWPIHISLYAYIKQFFEFIISVIISRKYT